MITSIAYDYILNMIVVMQFFELATRDYFYDDHLE